MWPIKNFEKYLMAHQYMPKIFHGPHKNPPPPLPPTYLIYGPLYATFSSNLQPSQNKFNQGQTIVKKPSEIKSFKNDQIKKLTTYKQITHTSKIQTTFIPKENKINLTKSS